MKKIKNIRENETNEVALRKCEKAEKRGTHSSHLNRFLRQARLRLLQLLMGRRARESLDMAIENYVMLSKFVPTTKLETMMIKPSDIWEHVATLHMLTVEFNLKTILELGTAEGESTVALLCAAQEIGGSVYSIDVNPCQEAQQTVETLGLANHWNFIQGNDLQVNWNKRIDHLFIDTSHKYEDTMKELEKYEPYVREGGIITIHDIVSFPDVMIAILEYVRYRSDLRVYKYLNNNGLAIIFKG